MSKLIKWTSARKIETLAGFLTILAIITIIVVPLLTFVARINWSIIKWIWNLW